MTRRPPTSTLFPTRRSSDLPGGRVEVLVGDRVALGPDPGEDRLQAAAVDDGLVRVARQLAEPVEDRSEEHTSELQSRPHLVCRLLLEKKKKRRRQSCRRR